MKVYVVMGVNRLVNIVGPVGVALTPEGRDKVLEDSTYDEKKVFEMETTDEMSIPVGYFGQLTARTCAVTPGCQLPFAHGGNCK